MTRYVGKSTKKFLAAGAIALGFSSFGVIVSAATATADGTLPDTGTYDELLKVTKPPIQVGPTTGTHFGEEGTYDALLSIPGR